jgi:hypothetical protein
MNTCILSKVIRDVLKETGSKYVLNTCVNIGPQKKNITPIIPLAVTEHITHQP